MDSLSPKGRAVIEASRRALQPSASDRERLEAALRARLGPEALPLASSALPASQAATWGAAVKAIAVLSAVGAGVVFSLWPDTNAPPSKSRPATPAAESAAAPDPTSASAAESDETKAARPASLPATPPPRTRRAHDALAQEVALLARATSALKSGHASDALKALDAHRRKFPKGALSEERHAARAQALCSLGRTAEATTELAQLPPDSPTAAIAKRLCEASGNRDLR